MSVAPALVAISENIQTEMLKNMVLNLGWFDGDQTKFKDQQRGMQLFLKSNRVIEADNKITAILACLRRGVVEIYAQKKFNELDEEIETQDQNNFVKGIKTTFSNKTKIADAE